MNELRVYRHHLHRCPGLKTACIQEHPAHVWRCFRLHCTEAPDYLCGLIADTIQRRLENGIKNLEKGRETMQKQREAKTLEVYECSDCGATFTDKDALWSHACQ